MKNPIVFFLMILVVSFSFVSCDDDNLTPDPSPTVITTPTELTAALNDIYATAEAPGFAISIVKNDAILYQQAFGKADIEGNKAYTNLTTQPIGSLSKTFVAAAIVKAIEQGYFTLETDINDILPVEVENPKEPNSVIQIKHLVTHTSGLLDNYEAYFQGYHILPGEDLSTQGADLFLNGFGMQQREGIPLEDFLAEYYLEGGDLYSMNNFASTPPGSTWNYSNLATSLAAYLVEVATGKSFKEYVTSNILQPLGMNKTAYDVANLDPVNVAKLYWEKSIPLPTYANDSYPDGSINTCNEDLAKYLMDMMKGAKGQSTTLFSTSGYEMLFEALLPDGKVSTDLAENQAMFWFLDGNEIKHDGSDPGTTSNFQFDKNGNSGYFFMTNMDASTDENETAYFQLAGKVHHAITEFIENN